MPDVRSTAYQRNAEEFRIHINKLPECAECINLRKRIVRKYGYTEYLTWFTKCSLKYKNNAFVVSSNNGFVVNYVGTNYMKMMGVDYEY